MSEPITLEKPITRGEQTIPAISLRKPDAGALRGIVLSDLLRMEAGAVADLLPRITKPPLLPHEVARMDAADLMACAVEISNFLLPRSLKPAG
ncbi:MAG: phage tail assembly protein [Novosphingobium sp.]